MDPELLRAALGWNAGHYVKHFERLQRSGKTWLACWNWAAFLHSTGWFWYRRMYGWSLLNLIAPVVLLFCVIFVVQWFVPPDSMGVLIAAGGIAYAAVVYGLLPVYADSLYLYRPNRDGRLPKPPSAFTAFGALLVIVIPATLAYISVEVQKAYEHRARIAEGLTIAASLRAPIGEFYASERRLPGEREAAQFRHREPMKHTTSVAWDPARRSIVATMGEREDGKRVELVAAEKDGVLVWTCRNIDLKPKYLRADCR